MESLVMDVCGIVMIVGLMLPFTTTFCILIIERAEKNSIK